MDKPVITVAHGAPAVVRARPFASSPPGDIVTLPAATIRDVLTTIVTRNVVHRRNP
jgi:hypothetical protein